MAPFSSNTCTHPGRPCMAARCSGVAPWSSLTLTNRAKPLPSFDSSKSRPQKSQTAMRRQRSHLESTTGMVSATERMACRHSTWPKYAAWCRRRRPSRASQIQQESGRGERRRRSRRPA
uniref:Uncharacterized protein n=1 Tax=Arundo donax TaxID=35708 RepID=A0A0A9D564_ARUDO